MKYIERLAFAVAAALMITGLMLFVGIFGLLADEVLCSIVDLPMIDDPHGKWAYREFVGLVLITACVLLQDAYKLGMYVKARKEA